MDFIGGVTRESVAPDRCIGPGVGQPMRAEIWRDPARLLDVASSAVTPKVSLVLRPGEGKNKLGLRSRNTSVGSQKPSKGVQHEEDTLCLVCNRLRSSNDGRRRGGHAVDDAADGTCWAVRDG
jgi:hypothetical protein